MINERRRVGKICHPVSLAIEERNELRYNMSPELRFRTDGGWDQRQICVVRHDGRVEGISVERVVPSQSTTTDSAERRGVGEGIDNLTSR